MRPRSYIDHTDWGHMGESPDRSIGMCLHVCVFATKVQGSRHSREVGGAHGMHDRQPPPSSCAILGPVCVSPKDPLVHD